MIEASLAAHMNHHVMTLDHTAAYLNADMKGTPVEMMLSQEVTELLCDIDPNNRQFVRPNGKIYVRLKKALYGCVQSAVLLYKDLKSTLVTMGFTENIYDVCSFTRLRGQSVDRILVYVNLFITADAEPVLDEIDRTLREKYGGVTSKKGKVHEYLGIRWDFNKPREVTLSMQGYINDLFKKYTISKLYESPSSDDLFTVSEKSPADQVEKRDVPFNCYDPALPRETGENVRTYGDFLVRL